MKTLNDLRKRPEWANYKRTRMSRQNRRRSAQSTPTSWAAIEPHDPVAAYERMRAHLSNVRFALPSWHADETEAARTGSKRVQRSRSIVA